LFFYFFNKRLIIYFLFFSFFFYFFFFFFFFFVLLFCCRKICIKIFSLGISSHDDHRMDIYIENYMLESHLKHDGQGFLRKPQCLPHIGR
jgi:hypothetical protein